MINSISPASYANLWATSLVDWKPFTGDLMPKIFPFNKPIQQVGLDLFVGHVFYGLGKLPITSTKITSTQKLVVGTANSIMKGVVKKTYSEAIFSKIPGPIQDGTQSNRKPALSPMK